MGLHVSDTDLDRHRSADLAPEDGAEVEAHLAACDECQRRYGQRAADQTEEYRQPDAQAKLLTPERVGPYRVLEEIGEGGMGTVYLAEQTEPIRRRVALKIIKLGMDTKAVIARFEAERQALALMDHPNVAKVYDTGATEHGRPYFAMELVEGVPITDYCDRHLLTTQQRLELFILVCRAVQHAHQKGIIHRDIKPSNVMVAVHEDQPVPKVIDFGVAKATAQKLTERTLFTEQGQLIGTPEYMSPEQAEMTGLNVDTRTDVYSLGVVLYELLAGALPFEPSRLRGSAFAEIQRIIREEEPLRPSTRLSSHGVDPAEVAKRRRTDLHSLTRQLRGELDWIAMKAIQKDRTRRYDTAADLAADVARFLEHQPVLAGPPSTLYNVKKFVQRHRAFVTSAAVVLLVLIGGITASTILAVREASARAEVTRTRDDLQVVVDFQRSMLSDIDAQQMGRSLLSDLRERVRSALLTEGASPGAVEAALSDLDEGLRHANGTDLALQLFDEHILARAVVAIDRDFSGQPLVRAALMETIATTYGQIGVYESALPLQESAVRTRREHLGDEDPFTLVSIRNLGDLCKANGEYDRAVACYEEALAGSRRVHGDEHPGTLLLIHDTSVVLQMLGRYEESLAYGEQALEAQRRVLGSDHEDTLSTMNGLGVLLNEWGRAEESEPYYREALEGRRRLLGDEHPATMSSIGNMGWAMRRLGDLDTAEALFREQLDLRRRVLGNDHPSTLFAMDNVGGLLVQIGELEQAGVLFREALEGRRRVLGEDHRDTLRSLASMGSLLRASGDLQGALRYNREALARRRGALGEGHPRTVSSMQVVAQLLRELGQLDEAAELGAEAVRLSRRETVVGARPFTGSYLVSHGRTLVEMGRYTDAERALLEGHEILASTRGEDHPQALGAVGAIIQLYNAWHSAEPDDGHAAEAAEWQSRRDR